MKTLFPMEGDDLTIMKVSSLILVDKIEIDFSTLLQVLCTTVPHWSPRCHRATTKVKGESPFIVASSVLIMRLQLDHTCVYHC